ncbi:peptidase S8 [Priestia megaterium]|uniref:S8 family peptidase n=1 Tax=Priestia megaterium TaxID=1404 RepID=UPI000BF2E6B1|nr:Ig-like domain-containing protein [Priestia megaterium]PEZ12453.1 peptidase S8 [Priestia megaterium]
MKKGSIYRFIAFALMFTLCFSQLGLLKTQAAGNPPANEKTLSIGKAAKGTFTEPEQTHWYKINPSKQEVAKFSHYRIKLQSDDEVNITVYSSLENAKNNVAFDRYMGYSYKDEPAQLDFPIAWTGPYYVKVEYYGDEDIIIEDDTEEDGKTPSEPQPELKTEVPYTISYEGASLPPSQMEAEECPAELSTSQKENGKGILKDLRTIRDAVLSKTASGKDLSSLYYKAAPFISSKMIIDKSMREQVYKDLVQLKGLFTDVAKNGASSTYMITSADQKAINDLYNTAYKSVPAALKKDLEKVAAQSKLKDVTDLNVSSVLVRAKLVSANSVSTKAETRYIVKLKDGANAKSFKTKAQSKSASIESINPLKQSAASFDNMFVIQLDDSNAKSFSTSSAQGKMTAKQIQALPETEFIEPVQEYHALSMDSQYPYQWSLNNTGKNDGTQHADIQYESLEKLLNGQKLKDTVIAVADTGVDSSLADLKGVVDTKTSYNYVDRSSNATDDNGHGTHVAGIIAASANNNYSMAGINSHAKILPVKILDASGSGDTEQIAYGIKYAVDHGAKVINLSLGGSYSRVLEYSLKYAYDHNVTVVAASGNDGMEELSYPASSAYAISVGASNRLDIVSDYSNYGKGLDITAPGSDIPSLVPDGNVTYLSGTSMATPHVAAAAGLLLSQNPGLKPKDVEKRLTDTAKDIKFDEKDAPVYDDEESPAEPPAPGYDYVSGWGRLNAYSAVSAQQLQAQVNTFVSTQRIVTGKAQSGSTVKVMNGSKTLGTVKADAKNTFSVNIPAQKADTVLQVVVTNGKASTSIRAVVQKAPAKPAVKAVTNKDEYVTGTSKANFTVNVKNSAKKVIASGKADAKGAFKVKIPKQKENTVLYITATNSQKQESEEVKVTVRDVIAPNAPKVNPVSDADKAIKGTAEANASVVAKVNNKEIGKAKANAKGQYSIAIKKQKAGTAISVTAADAANNTSKATTVKVSDKTPPAAPSVNAVTTKSTAVTGKTEANATVTVTVNKKSIGSAAANSKGQYSVKIKKQKEKTVLSVTAKDKANNTSKATAKTVTK